MNAPPTDAQIALLKKRLLKKGGEINATLTQLLAGKRVSVPSIFGGKKGQTEEERLRGFLALINERIVAIREGRYGKCMTCGDGLPFAQLEQVPWIDTCPKCFALSQADSSS